MSLRRKVEGASREKAASVRPAILVVCALLVLVLLPVGGCLFRETVDKALVTKRGVDAANAINAKAREGYDVRAARAKWLEALQAYTANDFAKTNTLIKQTLAILDESSVKVAERVYYNSSDGTRVSGLLFKPPGKGPWPLIVVCHAGFGEGADFSEVALLVRDKGYVVFNPDFRGSGKSQGRHEGAKGEVEDVISGIKYVKSRGLVDDNRIGVYGQSHGAAVAMLAASRYPAIKAVVEEAGFTDAVDLYNNEVSATDPQIRAVQGRACIDGRRDPGPGSLGVPTSLRHQLRRQDKRAGAAHPRRKGPAYSRQRGTADVRRAKGRGQDR